ncbi:MAG: CapA family protein [Rhodospirillaceae bacterium]|jgi:poly-gamma-glutamate synthesis protein (capsule biosynthesis protein)|nr:CapA family protein [Rhodospirillaceae bacterium]MBT8004690.1 CapA family protein [Rhodospirillales bacterium]MBT4703136.1 CapA family protein [Rhodospirillaceae bacterium]MBT5033913.1 CapA family protein [Rhodospirillaceae bacterium]MBT6220455.1 CapA family protein [Rhodospirillaceae bacterium]
MTMKQTLILTGDMNFKAVTDPTVPFRHMAPIVQKADVLFGNLECCFFDKPGHNPAEREGFYAPPISAEALVNAGFDAIGHANNVTFGEEPILATIARLDELGIKHTGAGKNAEEAAKPAVVEKDGARFGFMQRTSAYWPKNQEAQKTAAGVAVLKAHTAYRPHLDDKAPNRPGVAPDVITWVDPDYLSAYRDQISALAADVDVAVASHHWGLKEDVLAYQKEIAHTAIDSGAKIVMGHGPHMPLGVEIYKDRPVFYGMGNFSFDIGHRAKHPDWIGTFATVEIEDGDLAEVSLQLIRHNPDNETYLRNPGDEPEEMDNILNRSKVLGTELTVEQNRILVWKK